MAEHEWENGDAVWITMPAVIVEVHHPTPIRYCQGGGAYVALLDESGKQRKSHWEWLDSLFPRDPALDGADRPTAESEARRG